MPLVAQSQADKCTVFQDAKRMISFEVEKVEYSRKRCRVHCLGLRVKVLGALIQCGGLRVDRDTGHVAGTFKCLVLSLYCSRVSVFSVSC